MSRYAAFISYSHVDGSVARWLHRALETYRLPKVLVGSPSPFGPVQRRLEPIFRDRDELPASGDLGQELRSALADSRFQIVLCSPRAATSKWVNEEILSFKRVHGEARTLALIVGGEPYSDNEDECFPPALRFRLGPDGALSDVLAEPIAADLRPGKDGRRLALLKLVAGLAGVPLDALARRDQARRQQRLVYMTAGSLAIAALTAGLAIYAESQRRFAERQRLLADRSLDFLIGTFEIANPATENPRTITALSILERVSRRAGTELRGEPEVSARLLRTTGEIYYNLGLPKEAERDVRAALALERAQSEGRARALLRLSRIAFNRGDGKASLAAIAQAARSYDPGADYAPELNASIAEHRANVDYLEGRYAAAVDGFRSAATQYSALDGDHRRELGRVLMDTGRAFVELRRYDAADEVFDRAATIYTAKFGHNHVQTANTFRNQALGDFLAKRLARAEDRIDLAISIYGKVLEGDHPQMAAAMLLLGRIRSGRGDPAGAIAALDKARGIFARLYGATNAAVGDVDFYMAEALAEAGQTDAALARVANTKMIYDASYGPDDPDQVELLLLRSRILSKGGRTDDAQRACAAALALQNKLSSSDTNFSDTQMRCASM